MADTTEVSGQVLKETEKAFFIETDFGKYWLPKSQIKEQVGEDGVYYFTIPTWLYDKWMGNE